MSGGEQEDNDELVAEEVESELDSSLKPDHRFFAVRAIVEGGKQARKMNRRMKTAASFPRETRDFLGMPTTAVLREE